MSQQQKPKFPLNPNDTPAKAFERAMRYKLFYYAAQIARDYGLGDDLVREAAFKAYCLFDSKGLDVCKDAVLKEFGLTERVVVIGDGKLFRAPDRGFPPIAGAKRAITGPN